MDRVDLGHAMVETVRSPLLVLDESLRVQSANPAFYSVFDLNEEDVIERGFFELAHGRWDDPRLRDLLMDVLPTESEVRDLEIRVELKGLGTRVLICNARQIRFEGERRKLILLSFEDITRRSLLESEVQRHIRDVERSNRDLEEFAHAASHDLQEPLRKVRTYADRLASRLEAEVLDEQSRTYLDRMSAASERMQQRIDDMLRLARVGRTEPRRERVVLDALVRSVAEDIESSVTAAGARIEVEALPEIDADPAQLRLLFQNLLSNGIKFRREGSLPTVTVRAEAASEPRDTNDGATVRIVVADNGIGFEPHHAERIFQPFERLHGRESYEGTGIGLSICRRVMENHDGQIIAEGRPGEGARFCLTFQSSSVQEA